MVISVRTERGSDGLEVVKEADTDEGRARLRHEAVMLGRAAQPGVVEITATGPSSLRLRHRGTALSRLGALPPDHVAAVVRSIAEVVESIHRQGIAHTRIDRDHVVIGDRGRPRLCGFAEAADATDSLRAADVAALGTLLDDLLDASGDTLWSPIHRGPRHVRRRRKALSGFRAAAAAARRDDPGQRPTARQFATALHDALPDLALPVIPSSDSTGEFAAIPTDVDPTADIAWTDEDLTFLTADDDDHEAGDPFAKLAALSGRDHEDGGDDRDYDDRDDDWPDDDGDERTPARDRDEWNAADDWPDDGGRGWSPPPVSAFEAAFDGRPADTGGTDDPLPPVRIRPGRAEQVPQAPRTSVRTLVLIAIVVLVLGAVAGAAIARSVNPFDSDDASAFSATTEPVGRDAVADEPSAPSNQDAELADGAVSPASVPTPPTYPAGCAIAPQPGPDTDGDGCPEAVALDGRVATVGNVSVELGRDGDLPVLADHDCDGVVTPVLLRPETGEVFVFEAWSLDQPVEVDAATVVPGAGRIDAGATACHTVTVTDGSGTEHAVAGPGA